MRRIAGCVGYEQLHEAKAAKADEFYTRYEDVEAGLSPFRDRFRDATILLDTNDGDWSMFWRFLNDRFDDWGLERVLSLSRDPDWGTLFAGPDAGGMLYERDAHGVRSRHVDGSGGFDSPLAARLRARADLTVGNPPFSRMGDYLASHAGSGFLCLGPMTAVTRSDVFPLFRDGVCRIAAGNHGSMMFRVPDEGRDWARADKTGEDKDGSRLVGVKGVVWYTDLPCASPSFTPVHGYDPAVNPFYDNLPHGIVEASEAALIPVDGPRLVGAPVSILANWPEGYVLRGMFPRFLPAGVPCVQPMIDGRCTFKRLLIERV